MDDRETVPLRHVLDQMGGHDIISSYPHDREYVRQLEDAVVALGRDRDRLRDGIHDVAGWLVRKADEGRRADPDIVLMMLAALLDDDGLIDTEGDGRG